MFRMRRLLLVAPVAAALVGGFAFAEEPAMKIEPKASPALPAAYTEPQAPAAAAQPAPAQSTAAPCGTPCGTGTIIMGQSCQSCGPVCCDNRCGPKAGVFGDFLYLKARNSDVPYARPVDALNLSLPAGPVAQVAQDYEAAYRFGVWFAPVPEVVVRASYTEFNSSQQDAVFAPVGVVLESLVTHPNTQNAAFDSLQANANHDIQFRNIDLDATYRIWGGYDNSLNLNALGGVRYSRLEQNFGSTFLIEGQQNVFTSTVFEGVGPRMGLEGDLQLTGCLYGYGSGVLSLLVGRQTADYTQVDAFQALLVNTGYEKDRIVPVVDLEFGLGASLLNDHLHFRVGYMISSWYNIVTTNGLIQSVQQNDFTTNRDNIRDRMTFDGLVGRVEFRW